MTSGGFLLLALISGRVGCHRRNGQAFPIRIGVGQRAFQSLAAENDDKAMALAGLDDDFARRRLF